MKKIIVPISGGKDSQACLKLAIENHPREHIIGLFCDTKWEHPLTYKHIETLEAFYKVSIQTIGASSVEAESLKIKRLPSGLTRFCTDRLKIREAKFFYRDYSLLNVEGVEVWLGMRAGESIDRAKRYRDKISSELYAPHDVMIAYPKYLAKQGVSFRLPILDFTESEVFEYLASDPINPLYKAGFNRVGCFPCLATAAKNQEKHYTFDIFGTQQREKVQNLIKAGCTTRDNRFSDFNAPCSMCNI